MSEVRARAAGLQCKVIAVFDNVILCERSTDNTFITWRVAIYCGGVDFTSGCYDMTQAQGNQSLIERALGEQPAPVKSYTVWNPEHVACVSDIPEGHSADTYEDLMALEEVTGYSYSSHITTDDIDSVINAIQNECNACMEYHEHG